LQKECYPISEAAELVQVESHVLRYWEEELDLDVPRNEMGHRYYTQDNMEQFFKIRELKEKGYQLKEIRVILKEDSDKPSQAKDLPMPTKEKHTVAAAEPSHQWKLEQFQAMMSEIVKQALTENTTSLGKEMGQEMSDRVIKEMNYIMRVQDEQEEERFRKLDEAIRSRYRRRGRRDERNSGFGKKEKSLKPKLTT
jgi:Predicted transcriptional regulators